MLPLLQFARDGKEHPIYEAIDAMSRVFNLTDPEKNQPLPSRKEPVFDNRVRWATFHLRKAGLLETTVRGRFRIADKGLETLRSQPPEIDMKYLERFPEYTKFRVSKKEEVEVSKDKQTGILSLTPEELIETGYQSIEHNLVQELITRIRDTPPKFLERLVIDLLLRMGYGGSRVDAGKAIGRTHDGGLDGVIHQDQLGLEAVYVQAKRWDNTIGRPEIQKFVGALQPHNATKGVFITTSGFTQDAIDYASSIHTKIILIDGEKLARLMIEHNVGVSTAQVYEVKKIDTDYFTEE